MALPKLTIDQAKANRAAVAAAKAPTISPAAPTTMAGTPQLPKPTMALAGNRPAPTLAPKISPPAAGSSVAAQINPQMVSSSTPAPKLSAGQQSAQNWINNSASGQGGLDAYKANQQNKIKQAYAMGDQATVERLNKDMDRVGYTLDTPEFFGAPESVGANFRNDIEAQIAAMQGEQAAAQSLLQYQQGQNDAALQEQLQGLASAQAVDNQGAQELQNRRGGFYSGGLDYQLGNIGSAYASQRGALTRDVQARNAQLSDQYGTQSKTIAANIANLQKNQPQIIQEMIDKWQQTNAGLTGNYYGDRTLAGDQQDFSQNFDTNAQTGTYLPGGARELISNVLGYKQQYEQAGTPAERQRLNEQANAARSQLRALGVNPDSIGANVNSVNARTGATSLGMPTEDARQFNEQSALANRGQNFTEQQARIDNQFRDEQAAIENAFTNRQITVQERNQQLSELSAERDEAFRYYQEAQQNARSAASRSSRSSGGSRSSSGGSSSGSGQPPKVLAAEIDAIEDNLKGKYGQADSRGKVTITSNPPDLALLVQDVFDMGLNDQQTEGLLRRFGITKNRAEELVSTTTYSGGR